MGTYNRCVKNLFKILNRLWKKWKMSGPLRGDFLSHKYIGLHDCSWGGILPVRPNWIQPASTPRLYTSFWPTVQKNDNSAYSQEQWNFCTKALKIFVFVVIFKMSAFSADTGWQTTSPLINGIICNALFQSTPEGDKNIVAAHWYRELRFHTYVACSWPDYFISRALSLFQ